MCYSNARIGNVGPTLSTAAGGDTRKQNEVRSIGNSKTNWLRGGASKLSLENEILMYKMILIWNKWNFGDVLVKPALQFYRESGEKSSVQWHNGTYRIKLSFMMICTCSS